MKSHEEVYFELMQLYTWQEQCKDLLLALFFVGLVALMLWGIYRSLK